MSQAGPPGWYADCFAPTMRKWWPILGCFVTLLGACGAEDEEDTGVSPAGYCAEYVPHENAATCRSEEDCTGKMEHCVAWNGSLGCPYPPQCYSDSSCPAGEICVNDGCQTACGPTCTADSCPATTTCGADGHCRAISCNEGFDCGALAVCDPTSSNADGRGCVQATCKQGSDCKCGVCMKGFCSAGPGWCSPVPQ